MEEKTTATIIVPTSSQSAIYNSVHPDFRDNLSSIDDGTMMDQRNERLQVLIVKSVCLTVLWLGAFVLCCFPLCVSKFLSRSRWWKDREKRILAALNYGSGGVFLATIFLDLLPELDVSYKKAFKSNGYETQYPFAQLTVILGMLLFVFMEQIIIYFSQRCFVDDDIIDLVLDDESHRHNGNNGHAHSVICGNHSHYVKCRYKDLEDDGASESLLCSNDAPQLDTCPKTVDLTRLIKQYDHEDAKHDYNDNNDCGAYHQNSTEIVAKPQRTPCVTNRRETQDPSTTRTATILRSFSLMFALSLHSVFEGLVVGFQTEQATVWKLFFALLVHKSLVAFSLGSKFATVVGTVTMRTIIGMAFIFSLAAPIGGVVSTAIGEGYDTDTSPSFQLFVSLSSGVASGSFLFVTFFEILRTDGGRIGFTNSCFMTLGFALTAII